MNQTAYNNKKNDENSTMNLEDKLLMNDLINILTKHNPVKNQKFDNHFNYQ